MFDLASAIKSTKRTPLITALISFVDMIKQADVAVAELLLVPHSTYQVFMKFRQPIVERLTNWPLHGTTLFIATSLWKNELKLL